LAGTLALSLIRFIELDAPNNNNPEEPFISWENTVIVKANDLALAPNLQIGSQKSKLQLAKQHSQAELGNERKIA
jgi:hypothetical protein